ncbi:MAG: hypothetical protein Hals2KO_13210 [Halioglobus sp.]
MTALLASLLIVGGVLSSDAVAGEPGEKSSEEHAATQVFDNAAVTEVRKNTGHVIKSEIEVTGELSELEGALYILHADNFESETYQKIPVFEENGGRVYELEGFAEEAIVSFTVNGRAQVRIVGQISGAAIRASQIQFVTPPENLLDSQKSGLVQGELEPPTSRPYRIGVLYAVFSDDSNMPWYDADHMEHQLFNRPDNIKDYFLDSTHDKVVFKGKYGFYLAPEDRFDNNGAGYAIPHPSTVCAVNDWLDAAETLAAVDGYNRADFDQIIFVTPETEACDWSGIAGLAGYKATHINWNATFRLLAHEIGHNFGLGHALGQFCWVSQGNQSVLVPLSDDCIFLGYGDTFDIMGNAGHVGDNYYFQMAHRAELSGLTPSQFSTGVNAPGVYQITPMEYNSPSNAQRQLVVPTRLGAETPRIYIEYRQPYRFDDFSASDPVATGVLLRRRLGSSNILINNHPFQPMRTGAPLQVGETFEYEGARIRLLSTSPSAATLFIEPGPQKCQTGDVTINGILPSPLQLQSGEAGGVVTVKAQNNGTVPCYASVTDIQNTSPPVTHSHTGNTLLQPGDLLLVDFDVPTLFGVTSNQSFTADFEISGAPVAIDWEVVPGNLPCGQLWAESGVLSQMFPTSIPVNQVTNGVWNVTNNGPLPCPLDMTVIADPYMAGTTQLSFLTVNGGNLQPTIAPFSSLSITISALPTSVSGNWSVYSISPIPTYPDVAYFGFQVVN